MARQDDPGAVEPRLGPGRRPPLTTVGARRTVGRPRRRSRESMHMEGIPPAVAWPPLQTLMRLMLALAVGLFVGLEREWRGKEAGLRTFGFASLLGGLGGLLGPPFAILAI